MKHKAVVLGANYYIGLSTIRSLGVHDIPVVAVDYGREGTYGFHSRYCSEQLVGPHYAQDPDGLVAFLLAYAKAQSQPPVLIPCADPYVALVDAHLDTLRQHFLIPQTEPGLYTRTMNKESIHALAKAHGVAVPETLSVHEENLLERVDEELTYPCLVKPVTSPPFVKVFRRKLFKVDDRRQLEAALARAAEAGLEVVVQRLIPGFDDHMYTFDAYLDQNAQVTHWMTAQKLRQFPINYGASVYTLQRYVPELYEIGAPFLQGIGYKGFAEIEFKQDAESGIFYLIEVNVRMTTLNNLMLATGINVPYITYQELTGGRLPAAKGVTADTGIVFWYAFEDLLAVRDYLRAGQLTLLDVLASYFKPKVYAIWDWQDPQPAFAFVSSLLRRTGLGRRPQKEEANAFTN